jgi:hypothetical protein
LEKFEINRAKERNRQMEKLTLELTKEEARGLLNCILTTNASGKDLDVGEMIEEKLFEFLKQ